MKIKLTQLLFVLIVVSHGSYGQVATSENSSSDTAQVQQKPESVHVVSLNFELERMHKKLAKISHLLEPRQDFIDLDSLIVEEDIQLKREREEFKKFNPNNLSKYFLENTYRSWSLYESKLGNWQANVNDEISHIEGVIDELEQSRDIWLLSRDEAIAEAVPDELVLRISEIIREIDDMKIKFLKYRRDLFIREDKIIDLIAITDDIRDEVAVLQQRQRDDLFVADKPNLWKVDFKTSDIIPLPPRLKKAWHENAKTVRTFSREFNYVYLALIVLLLLLFYALIIQKFRKLKLTDADPHFVSVERIFLKHPVSSFVFFVLTLIITILPNMPLIMIGILGIVLLFLSLVFMPQTIGPQGRMIIQFVLILYFLNFGEILFWYFGQYSRIYVTVETMVAIFLTFRFGLAGLRKKSKNVHPFVRKFSLLSVVLLLLFCVAFISSLLGFMNLAVLTQKIGVKTAAIAVIIYSAYVTLRSIIYVLSEIGRSSNLKLMANHWDGFEKRGVQLLNILAIIYLFKFILQNMEIYRGLMDWLIDTLEKEWVIGTLHLSIGGILSMILILAVTLGVSYLIKTVIEDVFLPKSKLPKGVPAAISVTIRYFIITFGVIIALSAAGIELGKFGLLAGALGVGIGFGLQNIVNNFISGLILVYGRPVNVGDTIEVENLMGTVNRIGIRSSNVRTYDGAEVIVPNGNLISNQLINWTLSDSKRRMELKIGAAYGSDPNLILELLKKVAMEHKDVLKDPEPRALFEEFGDSSLNFRLLYWVHFEHGIGSKSDIAIGIYNIFAENDIQIPFPQVDLHLKNDQDKKAALKTKSTRSASAKVTGTKKEASMKSPK